MSARDKIRGARQKVNNGKQRAADARGGWREMTGKTGQCEYSNCPTPDKPTHKKANFHEWCANAAMKAGEFG